MEYRHQNGDRAEAPLISVLHPTTRVVPTKEFPRGWRDAHDAFLAACEYPYAVEYVLSVHVSKWGEFWESDLWHELRTGNAITKWGRFRAVVYGGDQLEDCAVANLNNAAQDSSGRLLTAAMDDYYPPKHWDTLLVQAIAPEGIKGLNEERLLVCSSGSDRDRELMIAGAITRARYNRYGYILHPKFRSMYADNYYALVARRDAAAKTLTIIERLDIVFDHRHPSKGTSPNDAAYEAHGGLQAHEHGRKILAELLAQEGLTVVGPATATGKTIAILWPGYNFSAIWVVHLLSLVRNLERAGYTVLDPFNCYCSDVANVREMLRRAVNAVVPKPDYVLWLDHDNVVTYGDFVKLMLDLDTFPELSGVFGWCWVQADAYPMPAQVNCGRLTADLEAVPFTPQEMFDAANKNQLMQVGYSGFPGVLMRASVLSDEAVGKNPFVPLISEHYDFGKSGEDIAFCVRATKAGYKFAVDPMIKLPHYKLAACEPPDAKDRIKPTPAPTAPTPVTEGVAA